MNYFNFNSRETYIVAATQWKQDYAELSQKIRDVRKQFNEAQKAFSKTSAYNNHKAYWDAYRLVEKLRDERASLRYQATSMIGTRIDMKSVAQSQYEEARQVA